MRPSVERTVCDDSTLWYDQIEQAKGRETDRRDTFPIHRIISEDETFVDLEGKITRASGLNTFSIDDRLTASKLRATFPPIDS